MKSQEDALKSTVSGADKLLPYYSLCWKIIIQCVFSSQSILSEMRNRILRKGSCHPRFVESFLFFTMVTTWVHQTKWCPSCHVSWLSVLSVSSVSSLRVMKPKITPGERVNHLSTVFLFSISDSPMSLTEKTRKTLSRSETINVPLSLHHPKNCSSSFRVFLLFSSFHQQKDLIQYVFFLVFLCETYDV